MRAPAGTCATIRRPARGTQKSRTGGPAFDSNPATWQITAWQIRWRYLHLAIDCSAAEMPFSEKT